MTFYSGSLQALPRYTILEKKKCCYCHISQKGGGPLNDAGVYYRNNNSLVGYQEKKTHPKKIVTVQKKRPLKKKPPIIVAQRLKRGMHKTSPQKTAVAPKSQKTYFETLWDKTRFFGNARFWSMIIKGGPKPKTFFMMQAEPGVAVKFLDSLQLVLSYNVPNPLLTSYLQYEFLQKHYVQAGMFQVPFGFGYEDHTAFLIDQLHVGIDTRDLGLMFGSTHDLFYKMSLTFGKRYPEKYEIQPTTVTKSEQVLTANLGYQGQIWKLSSLIGFSFIYERNASSQEYQDRNIEVFDAYGSLRWGAVSLFAEAAFAKDKPTAAKNSLSAYVGLSYDLLKNLNVLARYDGFVEDAQFLADYTHRVTLGGRWKFWKNAALEPYYRYEESFNAGTNITPSDSFFIMGHLFF
ncbi:MAG: hypothetical protein HYS98_00940 [Deltaproteobacteria bacterium]|nr:hypothetical protein [Deltaproteobacteria bacterium]